MSGDGNARDIWSRVDEAIDTDPLLLRGIVAELLARAEAAEGQLSARREHETRWGLERQKRETAEAEARKMRDGLAAIVGVDPCIDWGDILDQVNEIRGERDAARREVTEWAERACAALGAVERVRALRGRSSMGRVNDYVPIADVRAALGGGE